MHAVMAAEPSRSRRVARAAAAYRSIGARRRRLEMRLERRFPGLYDARHAASGLGRALWPLVGPLLSALLVLPVVALLVGLDALLDLEAPSIDLPSVDIPHVPSPNVSAPDWLRAIGDAIGAAISAFGDAAKYIVAVGALIIGVVRTREVRRKRMAAEQVGRRELLQRLAVALRSVEAATRTERASTIREAYPGTEGRVTPPAAPLERWTRVLRWIARD